jgi:histidinol-phosphatase
VDVSLDADLELAHRLADIAAEAALAFFERGVTTTLKQDGTPVSEADLEVERLLVETLARERPADAVLTEETGALGVVSSRRWILDPIDGTFNFVAGHPAWGTHIALECDGEIVLGVVTRPVRGTRWWASRGAGAHRTEPTAPDGRVQLRVTTERDLARSRVALWSADASGLSDRLRQRALRVEPSIDNILELVEGDVEAVIDAIGEPWDHAPMVALVAEAGGRFRDAEGGRLLDRGMGIYTNGCVDEALDRVIAETTRS